MLHILMAMLSKDMHVKLDTLYAIAERSMFAAAIYSVHRCE
jgi:hypothetical protein